MLKNDAYHEITYIHQILIKKNKKKQKKLPPLLALNSNEARRLHPDAKYIFWEDAEISKFIKENFEPIVYETYQNITAFAYKADLARYCILYIMGGMYIDLGIRMMNFWEIPKEKGFSTFKELCFTADSWTIMQNGLIWSLPKRRELEICINRIVENYCKKFYGKTPLYPTGPVMFGRAIALAMAEHGQSNEADDQWIGEYRWTTPEGAMKNDAYISPSHKLIAFRTKLIPGDLSHLGLIGTNNYKDIWSSRKMYNEKGVTFLSNSEQIRLNNVLKKENGFFVCLGTSGVVLSGPYISLLRGKYSLRILFDKDVTFGGLTVDVTIGGGSKHVASKHIGHIKKDSAKIDFLLTKNADLVEFVVNVNETFSGTIIGFELEKHKIFSLLKNWNFFFKECKRTVNMRSLRSLKSKFLTKN